MISSAFDAQLVQLKFGEPRLQSAQGLAELRAARLREVEKIDAVMGSVASSVPELPAVLLPESVCSGLARVRRECCSPKVVEAVAGLVSAMMAQFELEPLLIIDPAGRSVQVRYRLPNGYWVQVTVHPSHLVHPFCHIDLDAWDDGNREHRRSYLLHEAVSFVGEVQSRVPMVM